MGVCIVLCPQVYDQNLPKVILCNVNKYITVGHIAVCYVTWQCVTYTYGCTHSERGSIPRAEIKIAEEVKTFKSR